jgi:hypothetical protein
MQKQKPTISIADRDRALSAYCSAETLAKLIQRICPPPSPSQQTTTTTSRHFLPQTGRKEYAHGLSL